MATKLSSEPRTYSLSIVHCQLSIRTPKFPCDTGAMGLRTHENKLRQHPSGLFIGTIVVLCVRVHSGSQSPSELVEGEHTRDPLSEVFQNGIIGTHFFADAFISFFFFRRNPKITLRPFPPLILTLSVDRAFHVEISTIVRHTA
jgi:hypothetical protein